MMKTTKCAKFKMSDKNLSNFLYNYIIFKCSDLKTFGVGIYNYDRHINKRHIIEAMFDIDPNKIEDFENQTGLKLTDPLKIHLN